MYTKKKTKTFTLLRAVLSNWTWHRPGSLCILSKGEVCRKLGKETHGRALGNLWEFVPRAKTKLAKTFTLTSERHTDDVYKGIFGNLSNSLLLELESI